MRNKLLDSTELIHANCRLFKRQSVIKLARKIAPKSRFFVLLKKSNKIKETRLLSQNDFVIYTLAYNNSIQYNSINLLKDF